MCGICGFFSPTPHDVTATAQMLSRTRHRGPDQVGIYLDGERFLDDTLDNIRSLSDVKGTISLGHARLEIIGGPEGAQPITGCRRGWAIVVNGEIYNHVELRRFMSGHPMKTESDSELILHLIETHHQGDLGDAVRRTMPYLDGMYAFAVTDGETLVVARDPIGKKPVYFTQGSILAFASERKALTDFDAPIRRLTPGGILVIGPEGFRVLHTPRFERPQLDIIDPDDALEQYRRAFERSVSKRVRGLDRIGVLFSGGIDSLLVAVGARAAGTDVTAYCVGMEGSEDLTAARTAADHLKLDVRFEILTESLIESVLPEVIERIELNGIVQVEAAIPMYMAARMCSEEGRKVMLTGQGADELFAGYPWYRDVVRDHGFEVLHERLWDDIEKLYLDTLEREDRMTMAHGIELRAPFLDRDVIRTAMRMIPQGIKIAGPHDPHQKLIHRRLAGELGIPRTLAYREKSPVQAGTGIHGMLQRLARRSFDGLRPPVESVDFGSNYRYPKEQFSDTQVQAFIAEVTERHGINGLGTANEEEYEREVVE